MARNCLNVGIISLDLEQINFFRKNPVSDLPDLFRPDNARQILKVTEIDVSFFSVRSGDICSNKNLTHKFRAEGEKFVFL